MSIFHPDNEQLILDTAKLSQLVYRSEVEILATWKDVCPRLLERPTYFTSDKDAQAIGCIYRLDTNVNIFIIVYRGTSSVTDAAADANVGLVSLSSQFITTEIASSIKVHRGFFNQYASLESQTLSYKIGKLKDKDYLNIKHILFAGHSLGSISSIAASIPKLMPCFETFQIGLITFGGPRVGLKTFSQFLKDNVDWTLQIKNGRDPVVSVIPNAYGYTHAAKDFRQIGRPDPFPDSCNLFDLADHYISNYIKALQKDPLGVEVSALSWKEYIKGTIVNKPLAYLQSWAWF